MQKEADDVLKTAQEKQHRGEMAQAQQLIETLLKKQPKNIEAWHFYLQQLAKKTARFPVDNKNHEHALREHINAYEKLLIYENTLKNRQAQIALLAKLADIEDSPMIWVAYREACEQFFIHHTAAIDNDYAEVLKHYANAFSYGVLSAFKDKQRGKLFDNSKIQKISPVELSMVENALATQAKTDKLFTFVNAYQLPYEVAEVDETPNCFNRASAATCIEQLLDLGFEASNIVGDLRMDNIDPSNKPHYCALFSNNATFATLTVDVPKPTTLAGRLWQSWRRHDAINLTFTTFFSGDVILKSLNKGERARYDAPRGYLVKCRGTDIFTQWQLHNNHVDELERRIDVKRLSLSPTDYWHYEAVFADKLLTYKKSHGFMTFSEYHRATNIESRLSYSLILDKLAQRIASVHKGFLA